MKVNIGFPKEGEKCRPRDLWKAWSLQIYDGWKFRIVTPIGKVHIGWMWYNRGNPLVEEVVPTNWGYLRIVMRLHWNIIEICLNIPMWIPRGANK